VKLLFLLPDFGYHAAARQVSLLAKALGSLAPPARLDVHAAALGPDGPLAAPLRAAGVPVHALGTGRRPDPAAWWRWRRLVAELRPDVVHAWRLPGLRAAGALAALGRLRGRRPFRLVVSEPDRGGRCTAADRRFLSLADAVTAEHPAGADRLQRLGVPADRAHALPPAVAPPPGEPPPLGVPLPPGARLVMCAGSLTATHGFRDALWATDILKYVYPDLHLVIVGDGPERARLRQFARSISRNEVFTHFLPPRPDAAALLRRAEAVWVPSRSECGGQVALEAQAAGRPVVASALPGLAALVRDGETGLLAPPGDPPVWASQTRRLLDDPDLARRIGNAARLIAAEHTSEQIAPAYAVLYERLADHRV
jgi:glycosyltransferase involved in cell wall biosynthesis